MANIFFESIKLKNFMSYEEAEVQLARNGYVVVKGTNNNPEDAAKSNGSGKSSLFTAICWALTGETISGAKNVSNIYMDGTTEVELSFNYDDREFVVNRTKNPSNLHVYVNGEDKSGKGIRDTEKILEEYIPQITYKLLSSVIILGQGLPQRFTNNTPAGRKEVLEQLSNSDFMIADIKDRLGTRKENLSSMTTEKKIEFSTKSALVTSVETEIGRLTKTISSMSAEDIKAKIDELELNISELEENYEMIEASIDELSNLKEEAEVDYNSLIETIDEDRLKLEIENTEELSANIAKIEAEKTVLEKEIKDKKAVKDVCPTCGQKIPGVVKIDTTELENTVVTLSAKITEEKTKLADIKAKNTSIVNEFEVATNAKKKELKDRINILSSDLTDTSNNRDNIYKQLSDEKAQLDIAKADLDRFKETVTSLSEELSLKYEELASLKDNITTLSKEIESLDKHTDVINQMNTLIKRDFRGYLLTNVVDYIQSRAKVYCNDIFGTSAIEFGIDGNNIVINYDGKEYEILSGGEKQKIDVIIQFSLRDMLCKFLDFSSNILILDEITDALDETGAHKVFDMISKRLSDVEAIYIISHHLLDFDIPEDSEIVIEKGCDKISRIK